MSERSTATSRFCCSSANFYRWAKSVNLDPAIHDVLSGELQSLLDATRTLPDELANEDSEAYQPYKRIFSILVEDLAECITRSSSAAAPNSGTPTDTTLATDLVDALFPIFSVPHHTITIKSKLRTISGRPHGADWRTPLNQLANFVWMREDHPGLSHVLECKLQLPKTGNVPETKCDSAVFFELAGPRILHLRPDTLRACSTLLNPKHLIHVLHWVTEYKKTGSQLEHDAVQQVMMGMVAGLYQRRTLGFPGHYVFGSAHSDRHYLRVFAGTWVPKVIDAPVPVAANVNLEEEVPKGAIETPGSEQKSQKKEPGSSVGGSARSRKRRKLTIHTNVAAAELPPTETQDKDELEIKMYELGQYLLKSSFDVAQLYLLMRGSHRLALEYKAAIEENDATKRLRGALARPPYDWPSQPGPKPNPPLASFSKRSLDGIQQEDDINAEHEDDLDIKSVTTNTSLIIGDPVQEAAWEDEWRTSYKEAIEKVGRGLPVHLSSVKRKRSESSEDRILQYVRSATGDVVDV